MPVVMPSLSPLVASPSGSLERSMRMAGSSTPTVEYRPRPDTGCSSRLTGRILDMHIIGFAVGVGRVCVRGVVAVVCIGEDSIRDGWGVCTLCVKLFTGAYDRIKGRVVYLFTACLASNIL